MRNGEDVDIEKMLGTGDPAKEHEWEEGMYPRHSVEISHAIETILG